MCALTAKISGWLKASPLERRVRPEGQKGAPSLEDVRSPRKTAGPRKRRSAARRIAGGAWLASAGGPKGLKAFGTRRSAGTGGCAHETGDGTNAQAQRRICRSEAKANTSAGAPCWAARLAGTRFALLWRALDRAVTAKHATVSGFWPEHDFAGRAFIEEQA